MYKRFLISCLSLLGFFIYPSIIKAQVKDICENKLPNGWQGSDGKLTLSSLHYKAGMQSVRWDWNSKAKSLQIVDTAFQSVANQPRSTFVFWIYNEKAIADKLTFEFKKGNQTASSFTFDLNFTGWRTAWVMYNRDMKGKPVQGMDRLTIIAPKSVKQGSFYFDQILYNAEINPRSPMRDEQVPFVNVSADRAANAHWTALYSFKRIPHYFPLKTVSSVEITDLKEIDTRFRALILLKSKGHLADLEKDFAVWEIKRTQDKISGKPVYALNDVELMNDPGSARQKNNFRPFTEGAYTDLMYRIASFYNQKQISASDKTRGGQMFLDMLDHMEDQGWSDGSGMGALHHLGYTFRDYYKACLLMKPVLTQHNLLVRTQKSMAWFSGLGRSQEQSKNVEYGNIDVFNTLLESMLSSILIMDDSPAKIRQLHEFSNWLSKSIMPNYAIEGTFKPDGAVFHHGTLYPAYGIGGFQGITPIIYTLSKTKFQINAEAQAALKSVLLTMSYYTNPIKWPVSIAGRHPTGNWKLPEEVFAYMALAGSPDGTEKIDTAMAGIYLKLVDKTKDKWATVFRNANIKPSSFPNGHWNLNYGLLDIHRRADWLLTVKGHNRYIVSHEAYPGANVFGRYSSYGQLEVAFPQTKDENGDSFKDEGWDWNNLPGTTTLHVPIEKLRANIINADDFSGVEEMLLSDEIFAGGTNLNHQQGLFAMKLHGHDKYDMGSFRAIKSYFTFDDMVVCLGSNITNNIKNYSTQTTILQNALINPHAAFEFNSRINDEFPYQNKWDDLNSLTVLDNRGIGYYIPAQQAVEFTKMEQVSRDQKDSKDTKGDVAKLIFNHGTAPNQVNYQYAMLIKSNTLKLKNFNQVMSGDQPVYKVLQQDSLVHSVRYQSKNITALAIFQPNQNLKDSLLTATDKACLIMYEKQKNTIDFSLTDPDLAFYSGSDDSPITADGKRKEVSIYSRKWYTSPSKPSVVTVQIKGSWKLSTTNNDVKVLALADGNTQLTISCKYGLASQFKLIASHN